MKPTAAKVVRALEMKLSVFSRLEDTQGVILAERMHRSGFCATCCPWRTVDCPDCIDAESVDFDEDEDD